MDGVNGMNNGFMIKALKCESVMQCIEIVLNKLKKKKEENKKKTKKKIKKKLSRRKLASARR